MKTVLTDLIARLTPYKREEIAYLSGVSISTVNKIMSGAETNPTLDTLTALSDFADKKERDNGCD